MARKKTTEVEQVEEVVVAETPAVTNLIVEEPMTEEVVEDKPKRSRKKKVEEPVVESVVAEEVVASPVVEEPVIKEVKEIVEDKPKKATKPNVKKSSSEQVIATANLYVLRIPGALSSKIGVYKSGTKFIILEEKNGWGKVAEGKWINLNYTEKI